MEAKLVIEPFQDEFPRSFLVFKGQISHMVDKQKKLGRIIANLLGKALPSARLQRQADNVGCPSHQLDQIVVSL